MLPWLQETQRQLQSSLQNNNLHHAILFYGKQGVGKRTLVTEFANTLLCQSTGNTACGQCKSCQLIAAGAHPDLHFIEPEKQIGVDEIRTATNKLTASSHQMQAKVLIIESAHQMTVAAANSLLKTLEEPTNDTYLFLLTDKLDTLLPTIKSRCYKQFVGVNDRYQVQDWLTAQSLHADSTLLDLYWYRPLYLAALLADPETNQIKEIEQDFDNALSGRMSPIAFADKYVECVELCAEWLQLYLSEQLKGCKPEAHDALWAAHVAVVSLVKQLALPGVNKTLLLNQSVSLLLDAVRRS